MHGQDEDGTFQPGTFVDFSDAFKVAAREKRFIVRDFVKADKAVDPKAELADAEVQLAQKQAGLERWCRAHYGEVFSAWIHLKTIRALVESVLRYGLSPVGSTLESRQEQEPNFTLAALKVTKGKSSHVGAALDKLMHVDVTASAANDDDEAEYSPYVRLDFALV